METTPAGRVDRDDLLRRIDLAALLDGLAPPAPQTLRRRWRCPHLDHEDRHPSVSMRVVEGIGRWRCWSCGRGGTAIDVLIAAQGLTVARAIEHLSTRALSEPIAYRPADSVPIPRHPSVGRYVDACHRILFTRTGQLVLDWLTYGRGLSVEVLQANRIGADPGPTLLHRHRGLPRAGLAAVLPVSDRSGDLTYVQARYLDPETGRKYGNPVARLGSNPGIAWIRTPDVVHPDLLVVSEGILDGLTAATAGLTAVAVLGATYPSITVADTIARHAGDREVAIAFDADEAGRMSAHRLNDLLAARGVTTRIWDLPEGTDLNSMSQSEPAWAEIFTEPVEVIA